MFEIQVDGASKGNPGSSGVGIVIKNNGEVKEYSLPLGIHSNHEAEFLAVIKALEICLDEFSHEGMIAFQTDSQIVVDAMEKNYVKNEQFKPLLEQITALTANFSYVFIKWIPSEQNKHADRLAREAIQRH